MQTFSIDVIAQTISERQEAPMPQGVVDTPRTAKYFALKQEDQVMFYLATDLLQSVFLGMSYKVDFSVLDDIVLVMPHQGIKARLFSVELNKEEKLPSVVNTTCTVNRAHESETIDASKKALLYYVVQCKQFLGLFSLRHSDMDIQVVFKT